MTTSTGSAAGSNDCESSACIQIDVYAGEHLTEPVVRVLSTKTGTHMQTRISEWRRFIAEVKNGDWDHVSSDWEFAVARCAPPQTYDVTPDSVGVSTTV